jgi:hypothetical protein
VSDCTVLIASADHLPGLKKHTGALNGEVLTFTVADALRAFEVIIERRPGVVALERLFAATPRGAALINRIKADPTLNGSEIRVIAHDTGHVRVSPRTAASGGNTSVGAATSAAGAPAATAAPAPPLDQRGTRRAPRFKMTGQVGVMVDGTAATLIDLSTIGAQIVSTATLKPNQRIRMALSDDHGIVRFNASIAWASFEIPPKGGPRYRAGVAFVDADPSGVDAFRSRHKA